MDFLTDWLTNWLKELLIGGSGSGKTRFYVKPNLMQCFPTSDYPTSFVITDPKGTLVLETGQMFQRAGYRVKIPKSERLRHR